MDENNYEYKFSAESTGLYRNSGEIFIRIPKKSYEMDKHSYWTIKQYSALMHTMVHEAIHRKVHHEHGDDIVGHGMEFQRECLYFGLDPHRESFHDKRVEDRLYPMDKNDYKKYRDDGGYCMDDPCAETDAGWKLFEKHEATYNRRCPAYENFEMYVGDMIRCQRNIEAV